MEGNSEAMEVLLRNGADIYVQDKDDKSVLYWAAAQNHQNVIKVCNSYEEYNGKIKNKNLIQFIVWTCENFFYLPRFCYKIQEHSNFLTSPTGEIILRYTLPQKRDICLLFLT